MFRRSGTTWSRENLPATGVGQSVALDGDTLAIGDPEEASGNGQPGDQSAPGAGAVRVYSRAGSTWTEVGYLKASNPQATTWVGLGVSLRDNVVTTTIPGTAALQAFEKVGGVWVASAPLPASGPVTDFQNFGRSIVVTPTGTILSSMTDREGPADLQQSGTTWFFR